MKKRLLFLTSALFAFSLSAQNPTDSQKLYYTCKVYGLVKYFHSEASTCQVNWDSAVVANLPAIRNALTWNDFNNALDTLLMAAGPMDIAITPPPPVLPPELRYNLNFGWTNDTLLSNNVQSVLDTILFHYRPGPNCWVQNNSYTNNYTGWLVFPYDSLMYNADTYFNFPSEEQRALMLFKYWNIINYFNPYNYVLDQPWDSTLAQQALNIVNATTTDSLFLGFNLMTTALNDIHAEGLTWSAHGAPNYYCPRLILKYAEGKYIAAKAGIAGIAEGDEITAIDGLTTTQWEDSLRPFISAGDSSVFRRTTCDLMLRGLYNSPIVIETMDSLGVSHTYNSTHNYLYTNSWFNYYENDTLFSVKWRLWDCNVGYVHMGNLLISDVSPMYSALQNTDAIIFDIRNYPNGTGTPLVNAMLPQNTQLTSITEPDVNWPGTFFWFDVYRGNNNPNAYNGQVIILVNEETQSQAEYVTMMLQGMPNVVVVGSQTAGADGNVVYFNISQDIQVGYTGLGIFYPNHDSTQRIGIVPDSLVERTQEGIRHGRDIVLEKAMEIAGCVSAINEDAPESPSMQLFPNPASAVLTITFASPAEEGVIEIFDNTGRLVLSTNLAGSSTGMSVDVSGLASGLYLLRVKCGTEINSAKFIKE